MCVFAALRASKGVAGFMRTREGGSKGGGGFIWARNSSPCGTVSSRKREKVRPARSKHPKFGVFVRAGRDFSRKGRWRAVLGELCRADWHCARVSEAERLPPCRQWWGFCTTRGLLVACRRRVGPSCSAIPPLLSAASGFVCTPGFPRVLMGAHTFALCSRNVTVSQVCSRHIQRRLWHRIRAGTPAEGASITSTTTRP